MKANTFPNCHTGNNHTPRGNASGITRFLGFALVLGVMFGTIGEAQSAYIYFSEFNAGRISRANLDGSGKVTLISGILNPTGPALDLARGHMYWGEVGGANIRRANLDGSGQIVLVSGRNGPGAPALDLAGGRMYWNDSGNGVILRANLDGFNPQVLVSGQNDPHAVVLDLAGGKVYWPEFGAGNIRRANLDGTGVQILLSGLAAPVLMTLDLAAGKMYWANHGSSDIRRANHDGTGQEILVRNQNTPTGIAFDLRNSHIYWSNADGNDIRRANLDGSGQQTLITGLSGPIFVTLDLLSDGSPTIQYSPPSQSVPAGGSATLAVGAAGLKPLRYQWLYNGAPLPDATNATLTLSNLMLIDTGSYSVSISNSIDSTLSQIALLNVVPVLITAQTGNTNVWPGSNVLFQVAITSTVPASCQWRFNGADIPSATNLTFAITNVQASHEGEYTAALVNSYGSVTSAPTRVFTLVRPVILQPPLSQSVVAGGSVTLSVGINGNPAPFGFQWRRSSALLTNIVLSDRNCFLTLTNVQTNQGGTYRVVITNAASPTLTVNATFNLTVLPDTDGDGLPDGWESAHGLDANDSLDALLDADGDGCVNIFEYVAGTDPTNTLSALRIDSVAVSNGTTDVALWFQAISNKTYTVQSRGTVDSGLWSRAADIIATPTNRMVEISDPVAAPPNGQKFYRVVTPRIP